jgi:hypothetical protein
VSAFAGTGRSPSTNRRSGGPVKGLLALKTDIRHRNDHVRFVQARIRHIRFEMKDRKIIVDGVRKPSLRSDSVKIKLTNRHK